MLGGALLLALGCARRGSPVGAEDAGDGGYRLVGSLAIAGYAEAVRVAGDLAVLAASQGGLVLVDVSDRSAPVLLGQASTTFEATGCAVTPTDSIAYVTDGSAGVRAYRISDPTSPEYLGFMQTTHARDVVAVESVPGQLHHVFVADGEGGFRAGKLEYFPQWQTWFFDEIDHAHPDGHARGLCLADQTIFLAMEEMGLAIYDVTEPGTAVYLGGIDTSGEARAVAAGGGWVYVADWRKGLQVVDVSDPSAPAIVGSFDTEGYSAGVAYHDGRAFVADHAGGVRVFDVTDPAAPREVGYLETPFANDVFVTDSYVYVADRDWGLVIAEEE